MLDIKNISVTFHRGTMDERKALNHVSLHLDKGDFISVLGTNGAGKSTLLKAICQEVNVDEGQMFLDGINLLKLDPCKGAQMIGHLFQDPMMGTASHMSIAENLSLAYRAHKHLFSYGISKKERALFYEKLKSLDLGLEERMDSEVSILSGGQRQALTLLMATMDSPKLLLLDEHTAALDPHTANKIMKLSEDIIHRHQITAIMITHNIKQALSYGNKTMIMKEGSIVRILEEEERKTLSNEEIMAMYLNE